MIIDYYLSVRIVQSSMLLLRTPLQVVHVIQHFVPLLMNRINLHSSNVSIPDLRYYGTDVLLLCTQYGEYIYSCISYVHQSFLIADSQWWIWQFILAQLFILACTLYQVLFVSIHIIYPLPVLQYSLNTHLLCFHVFIKCIHALGHWILYHRSQLYLSSVSGIHVFFHLHYYSTPGHSLYIYSDLCELHHKLLHYSYFFVLREIRDFCTRLLLLLFILYMLHCLAVLQLVVFNWYLSEFVCIFNLHVYPTDILWNSSVWIIDNQMYRSLFYSTMMDSGNLLRFCSSDLDSHIYLIHSHVLQ